MKALNHDGRSIDDAQMLPMGAGILGTVREPPHQGIYHYRHLDGHGMPVGNRDGYTQYEVMYDPDPAHHVSAALRRHRLDENGSCRLPGGSHRPPQHKPQCHGRHSGQYRFIAEKSTQMGALFAVDSPYFWNQKHVLRRVLLILQLVGDADGLLVGMEALGDIPQALAAAHAAQDQTGERSCFPPAQT